MGVGGWDRIKKWTGDFVLLFLLVAVTPCGAAALCCLCLFSSWQRPPLSPPPAWGWLAPSPMGLVSSQIFSASDLFSGSQPVIPLPLFPLILIVTWSPLASLFLLLLLLLSFTLLITRPSIRSPILPSHQISQIIRPVLIPPILILPILYLPFSIPSFSLLLTPPNLFVPLFSNMLERNY